MNALIEKQNAEMLKLL